MATFVYATFEDVSESYENGPLSEDVRIRIERLITRASAKLTSLVPGLPNRLSNGEVDPVIPEGMVVESVLRVWRNPTGTSQQNVGPFGQTFPAKAATDTLTFDPDEVRELVDSGVSGAPSSFRVAPPTPVRVTDALTGVPWYQDPDLTFPAL
jgi:hypothetical protein